MAETPQPSTLAEHIERDFGISIPVTEGEGSRDAPWVLIPSNPADVERAICQLLSVFGLANQWLWRLHSTEPVEERPATLRVRIERLTFTDTEILTDRVAYYFRAPARDLRQIDPQRTIAATDATSGLSLPYKPGWLTFQGRTTQLRDGPDGVTRSAAYGAPGIKATLFLYPPSSRQYDNAAALMAGEFDNSESGLIQATKAVPMADPEDVPSAGGPLCRFRLYVLPDDTLTGLWLLETHQTLVKIRATFPKDRTFLDLTRASVETMLGFLVTPTDTALG